MNFGSTCTRRWGRGGGHRTDRPWPLRCLHFQGVRPTVNLCSDGQRTGFDIKCLVNPEVSYPCRARLSAMVFFFYFCRWVSFLFTPSSQL